MFLGSMSHELRTPLNHMIGYTEMLREAATERAVPELLPDLDRILEATQHLSAIISDILDLSKMETEEVALTLEEVDLPRLVEEIVETVRPLTERHGNVVSTDVAGLGSISADLPKVRLALLRPLTNACRFTHRGRITIAGRRGEVDGREAVELTITDTGAGMSAEQLARLFQGFYQPDASPMRVPGGTGLGLAIARRHCEAMGGTLVVASETGRGTVVTLTLPAVVEGA
jgi:signal transduction histidine kinase